jgi:hypothetical protein
MRSQRNGKWLGKIRLIGAARSKQSHSGLTFANMPRLSTGNKNMRGHTTG